MAYVTSPDGRVELVAENLTATLLPTDELGSRTRHRTRRSQHPAADARGRLPRAHRRPAGPCGSWASDRGGESTATRGRLRGGGRRREPSVNAIALTARQVRYANKAFWRNPASAFFTFAFPLMFLVIFTALLGSGTVHLAGRTVKESTYYVAAMAAFAVISACYTNVAMTVTFQRDAGILKRIDGTPLPAARLLRGKSAARALRRRSCSSPSRPPSAGSPTRLRSRAASRSSASSSCSSSVLAASALSGSP